MAKKKRRAVAKKKRRAVAKKIGSTPRRKAVAKDSAKALMSSELERLLNADLSDIEKAELNAFMRGLSDAERADVFERAGVDVVFGGVASRWEQTLGKSQPQNFTTYMEHNLGWTFACVRVIAFAISGAERKFYRKVPGKRKQDWQELDSQHPFVKVFEHPNDFITTSELLYDLSTQLELIGNTYWWMAGTEEGERLGSEFVKELWPLPGEFVRIIPGKRTDEWVKGYVYEPNGDRSKAVKFGPKEILHFRYPGTLSNRYGVGTLVGAAHAVNADEHIIEAQDHTFRNVVKPGFIMQKKGDTPEQRKLTKDRRKVMEMMLRRFVGAKRAGRCLLLSGDWEYERWGDKPAEMDFLKSAEDVRKRIMSVFNVGAAIFGMLENASRANMEAAQYSFAQWNIDPKLRFIQQRINTFLAPRFRANEAEELVMEFESVVPRNEEIVLQQANDGLRLGAISPNEWRMIVLGLDPLPKKVKQLADSPMINAMVKPLVEVEGMEEKKPPKEPPPKPDEGEDDEEDEVDKEEEAAAKKQKSFVRALKDMTPAEIADALAIPEVEATHIDKGMKPLVYALVKKGAKTEAAMLASEPEEKSARADDEDPDIQMDSEPFVKALEERAEDHWEETIARTNRDELLKVVREGIAAGKSALEIADDIDESIVVNAARRAKNIAQTETIGALNGGAQALREARKIPYKQWIATKDSHVRDTHMAAHNQVRKLNSKFRVGAAWLRYPADPASGHPEEVCNCRCASAGTFDKEARAEDVSGRIADVWVRQYDALMKPVATAIGKYFRAYRKRVARRLKQLA